VSKTMWSEMILKFIRIRVMKAQSFGVFDYSLVGSVSTQPRTLVLIIDIAESFVLDFSVK
ncbi:MAG: hypothetical protein NWE83_03930, partial [Candidatus Bathyarchaeota archaeon]|nr:hypothetical protein [Candidatus Bathyarchaeota archaeon]